MYENNLIEVYSFSCTKYAIFLVWFIKKYTEVFFVLKTFKVFSNQMLNCLKVENIPFTSPVSINNKINDKSNCY